MTYRANPTQPPSASGLSQAIFVAVGLGIITVGLWSLYMGDAPYHPDIVMSEGEIFLASE